MEMPQNDPSRRITIDYFKQNCSSFLWVGARLDWMFLLIGQEFCALDISPNGMSLQTRQ
jgi:hypothetical protein